MIAIPRQEVTSKKAAAYLADFEFFQRLRHAFLDRPSLQRAWK